jgi:hypothetical protein
MVKRSKTPGMPIINPRAAAIDIGSRFHVVAVPAGLTDEAVQTFQAFTGDLHRMTSWLKALDITTVAMESTGVYWVPVYEVLQSAGIEVIVTNALETPARYRGARATSTTLNGYKGSTPAGCCARASALSVRLPPCALICGCASGPSTTRPRTSSMSRRL